MSLEFCSQIFEKRSITNFHDNMSIASWLFPYGWTQKKTDKTQLTVVFRNFANAPENVSQGHSVR
jgi:hypothetical protein